MAPRPDEAASSRWEKNQRETNLKEGMWQAGKRREAR